MKRILSLLFLLAFLPFLLLAQDFTIEQITAFPFPSELTASKTGNRMAWAVNEKGKRNVYVSEGPKFEVRKLTNFDTDDGQEISGLEFTTDGKWLLFVRGGDHGGGGSHVTVNPNHAGLLPKVGIWKVAFAGGEAKMLAEGDYLAISPNNETLAFVKNNQVHTVSLKEEKPSPLFEIKGNAGSLEWSPDGSKLAFVANRSGHSLLGIYNLKQKNIRWMAPSFNRVYSPKWSPDGQALVYVQRPGGSPEPSEILADKHQPWSIHKVNLDSEEATELWGSPETLRGSVPTTHGGYNLHWPMAERIVFLSYEDGWPHMYAMDAEGGSRIQLTQGEFMVEHIRVTPDGENLIFSANAGIGEEDIDRRHIGKVSLNSGEVEMLTSGEGIEAIPVMLSDGNHIAYFSSTYKRPLMGTTMNLKTQAERILGEEKFLGDFPTELIKPKQVVFQASDGQKIHGQLFEKEGGTGQKPAVVFVHGGPQRQMLLGWHYGDYYSNTYAINQYLASQGFVVLSVNFRLGIGYGYEFHKAGRTYWQGAEEYLDVKAAGEYLAGLEQVDPDRIGIYGGSYGGYLTALALGKNPELFVVGVDMHGVHDFSKRISPPDGFEKPKDYQEALKTAYLSSPLAYLDTWKAPVLFIHADDDRNVDVSQTTDLIRRFEDRGMPYEAILIPDDTHHWMKFSNLVKVNKATVDFLKKHLNP